MKVEFQSCSSHFSDTHQEAIEFVERQRIARTPPVYNPARINEQPIPNIIPCRNLANEFGNAAIMHPVARIEQSNDAQFVGVDDGDEFDVVPFAETTVETIENVMSSQVSDGQNDKTIDEPLINEHSVTQNLLDPLALIKKELPFHDENIAEFVGDIMNENVEYQRIDDDVSIFVDGEFPLPYINTVQLKENDEFSGNRPFFEFVSEHLYFYIDIFNKF